MKMKQSSSFEKSKSHNMQRKTPYRAFLHDFHMANKISGKRGGICSRSNLLIGFPFL